MSDVAERGDGGLEPLRNLLALLEAEPDLLERAERWALYQPAVATGRRVRDEHHLCLCCGAEATLAFLARHRHAKTTHWLDLCHWCGRKLYVLSDAEAAFGLDGDPEGW